MMPSNQYVEIRNGGYYVRGARIGLDVICSEFHGGASPESIFEAYPSIGSLAKTYGVITFILEHPDEVKQYLREQDERYEEIKRKHPLPPEMLQKFESAALEMRAKRE